MKPTEEIVVLQGVESRGTELANQLPVGHARAWGEEPQPVNELRNLGYHIYQEDGIEICSEFLVGRCPLGLLCPRHHTLLPYNWQLRAASTAVWSSVEDGAQEMLERRFSDPKQAQVKGMHQGLALLIDFTTMTVDQSQMFDCARRISTSTSPSTLFHTHYKYYYEQKDDNWIEYDQEFVKIIENSLRMGYQEVLGFGPKFTYMLHLSKWYQENLQTGTIRRMRVRPVFRSSILMPSELRTFSKSESTSSSPFNPSQCLSGSQLEHRYPETWRINGFSDYEKIPLRYEDSEFLFVYSNFHQTMLESQYIILEISRTQNYFQWERYTRKRGHMSQKLSALERNSVEWDLFHGTDLSFVEAVCRQNFDPRVCGKHGTAYGQGCYFAKKADYSHSYSTATSDGHHYMFLAKVLVGRPALGSSSLRRPPPIHPGDPASHLYNSCVSRLNDPEIFVIFDNDQCYPYFIIKYQKMQDMVIVG